MSEKEVLSLIRGQEDATAKGDARATSMPWTRMLWFSICRRHLSIEANRHETSKG